MKVVKRIVTLTEPDTPIDPKYPIPKNRTGQEMINITGKAGFY